MLFDSVPWNADAAAGGDDAGSRTVDGQWRMFVGC